MIKRYKTTAHHRKVRVRHQLTGSSNRPRLSVHRTNKHIYAQIINDEKGVTLASASDSSVKSPKNATKTQIASLVGQAVATAAKTAKVKHICFDRGHYKYHGRVKALATAAREAGLEF